MPAGFVEGSLEVPELAFAVVVVFVPLPGEFIGEGFAVGFVFD